MADTLRVNELYGPTLQGEGPSAGQPATFLRLTGCNLACSWCDTPYTWDWAGQNGTAYVAADETEHRGVADVAGELLARTQLGGLVVITGGEPMLQQTMLADLIPRLLSASVRVEVETNGTIAPDKLDHLVRLGGGLTFNVSPKLANAGMPRARTIKPDVLRAYRDLYSVFKFVAAHPADLNEIGQLVDQLELPARLVWVMPEARHMMQLTARAQALAPEVLRRGWNMTLRLQLLLWPGAERGV